MKTLFSLLSLAVIANMLNAQPKHCMPVHGRYAIYANHDLLWIIGSKHYLEVTNAKLDKKLEDLDWLKTVAYGDFTICTESNKPPLQLTFNDSVELESYKNIQFGAAK